MKLDIKVEDLKDKKLFVAVPMYGGQCAGQFCKSAIELAMASVKYGINVKFYYLFNESLITRARNYCADEFLRSDCSHLLFIDADIGFNYYDVFALLHLCGNPKDDPTKLDVVTGPYPKKTIAWEKIYKATQMGYGSKNPFDLKHFVGDYVFNTPPGIVRFRLDEPTEICEGGTGFMMISRHVFEKYEQVYPELKYLPDHVRTEHFDGSREIMAYFDTVIDPVSKRYLSEDYMFSRNVRNMGMKIWMCPWMQLQHVGSHIYEGSMAAIAAIEASPTASPESNEKYFKDDGVFNGVVNKANPKIPITGFQPQAGNRDERRKQKAINRKDKS